MREATARSSRCQRASALEARQFVRAESEVAAIYAEVGIVTPSCIEPA